MYRTWFYRLFSIFFVFFHRRSFIIKQFSARRRRGKLKWMRIQWRKLFSYLFIDKNGKLRLYVFPSEGIPLCAGTFPLATARTEIYYSWICVLFCDFFYPLFLHSSSPFFSSFRFAIEVRVQCSFNGIFAFVHHVYITTTVQLV